MKTKAFRARDLMVSVLPRGQGGIAGLVGPDQDIATIPTPITPVVNVATHVYRFHAINRVGLKGFTPDGFNEVALGVGKAALGGMFLCTEEMATCAANELISPTATPGRGLRFEDLGLVIKVN